MFVRVRLPTEPHHQCPHNQRPPKSLFPTQTLSLVYSILVALSFISRSITSLQWNPQMSKKKKTTENPYFIDWISTTQIHLKCFFGIWFPIFETIIQNHKRRYLTIRLNWKFNFIEYCFFGVERNKKFVTEWKKKHQRHFMQLLKDAKTTVES